MKKFIVLLFTVLMYENICFATAETENLGNALKSSGYEPNYFSIVLSLVFVIFLIYVTGIIYAKLNKAGVQTLKKELKDASDIKPIVLSTTPIGKDKVLQVIEISGERMLIGVSQNSINLIKSLGRVENIKDDTEFQKDIAEVESVKEKEEPINKDDFGLYKKYLR